MAAGLGFKDFTTGEVLTAADVDGYLMQGIWVFASAAARDAAVTSPQEGNACYLKDTNQVLTYSGSGWVAVGGGSPLTTKGDIYGFSTADARIPIGTDGHILTADSAQTLGLKWAAPAGGGGWTSLASGSLSSTSTSVNITTTGYYQVVAFMKNITCTSDYYIQLLLNSDNGSNYTYITTDNTSSTSVSSTNRNAGTTMYLENSYEATVNGFAVWTINDPASTNSHKIVSCYGSGKDSGNSFNRNATLYGRYMSNSAITNITFQPGSTYSTGTYEIYGVK